MSSVKERLKEYIRYKHLTDRAFQQRIGASNAFINSIRKSIGPKYLAAIEREFPDLSRDWLLYGEGTMIRKEFDEVQDVLPAVQDSLREAPGWVPLLPGEALANPLAEYAARGVTRADCNYILSPVAGADFAITISGDSMEPRFHDGTIIFLKRINDRAFIPWGNPLVLDTENGAFIKEVYPSDNDEVIEARSINPKYPPMHIPKASIFGIYRILNSTKFYPTM